MSSCCLFLLYGYQALVPRTGCRFAYVSPSCLTCNLDQQKTVLTTIENAGWDPVVVFGGMAWSYMGASSKESFYDGRSPAAW
jgi:hypothetical protein